MIFTGTASALTGAPGSVLLYGAIGLMAWPRRAGRAAHREPRSSRGRDRLGPGDDRGGVASSAAGRGHRRLGHPPGGVERLLDTGGDPLPAPGQPDGLVGLERDRGHVAGEPSGYAHFLTSFGKPFPGVGTQSTWVLAVASLAIGLGPLLVRRSSLVPPRRWPAGRGSVGQRPGLRRRLHRFGHRPQYGPAGDPAGPRHGAGHAGRAGALASRLSCAGCAATRSSSAAPAPPSASPSCSAPCTRHRPRDRPAPPCPACTCRARSGHAVGRRHVDAARAHQTGPADVGTRPDQHPLHGSWAGAASPAWT